MAKKTPEIKNRSLHLVMQGKGGAGKSFVASLLCQYYQDKNSEYQAVDLDPINRSLAAIGGLNTEIWSIMKEDGNLTVDPERFDELIEYIVTQKCDVIVDNGSTSFLPFNNYLIQQDITDLLKENGVDTSIHCVIRGGASLRDCIQGLNQLCEYHSPESTTIYAWLNEVEGAIEAKGKTFEQMTVYKNWHERIRGIITLPEQKNELYQKDVARMLKNSMTFDSAIASKETRLVSKKRLGELKKDYLSMISVHI